MKRQLSFASPSQLQQISNSSKSSNRKSLTSTLKSATNPDSSIDAIHQALRQAGLGAAADKIANLIELSKKASRTGIQQEFL